MKKLRFWRSLAVKLFIIVIIIVAAVLVFTRLSSSVTKNIDDYVYELPFGSGAKYKIAQGYGGLFSHKHIAALDFDMPEGTAVFAAREGIIYRYKDDSDEGGPFSDYEKKANFIIVKHIDGSFGCYWHLKKNGVAIKNGPVAKGQLIGYSGATGFTLRPHLHFSVKRKLNYDKDAFVRTKFRTAGGIMLLQNREVYEKPAN